VERLYAQGAGAYYPGSSPQRTGDYSQAVVDPLDDNSFFTTAGYAGASGPSGGGFGWAQPWAYVQPIAASPPQFVGVTYEEDEGNDTTNTITLPLPSGSQKGDVFFFQVNAGLNNGSLGGVGGIDMGLPVTVSDRGTCNLRYKGFMMMHVYGAGSDSGPYTFTQPAATATCSGGTYRSELGGYVVSYRGACTNPWRLVQNYVVGAYPASLDVSTVSVGPITPPGQSFGAFPYDRMTLFNYLLGSAENDDSRGACSAMSAIAGTPAPTTRINEGGCGGSAPLIAGDNSPANHSTTFGPYDSSDGFNAPKLGYQILIPPY
jgi:hypothetical protein